MDERTRLRNQYWATIERILDLHGLDGNREFARKRVHKALKRGRGIISLSKARNEDIKALIDKINNELPYEHIFNGQSNNTERPTH